MGEGRSALLMDRRFLAALLVLLVNDWYLKATLGQGPLGLMTGKLSDVAAMVVGPVLVAALVPGAARGGRVAALLPPGLMLAAINLSAPLARAYESVLGGATGLEHRIVVDPTDLLGLVGLAAAWRILGDPHPIVVDRQRALAMAVGVFAVGGAAASSQDDGPNRDRVVVDGDRVVAASSFYGGARFSLDDGVTWKTATASSAVLPPVPEQPVTDRCLTTDPAVCVRLPDRFSIEESGDGGRTWRRVWRTDDGSERWLTSGIHGYVGTGRIELSDVAETQAGSVVVAASAIDPIRRGPEGDWRPTSADLRHFQGWTLAPLAVAVVFIMIGLSAIGTEPRARLGANLTVALALAAAGPGIWIVGALVGVRGPWLPVVAGVFVVAAMAWSIGGRAFVGGLAGGFGILLVAGGVLMALAYFVALDVIGFVLVLAIVPGLIAIALIIVVALRGSGDRLVLARNLGAGLVIIVAAAMPMAAWSAGWSDWETVNQLGPLLALTGAAAMVAVTGVDRAGQVPSS